MLLVQHLKTNSETSEPTFCRECPSLGPRTSQSGLPPVTTGKSTPWFTKGLSLSPSSHHLVPSVSRSPGRSIVWWQPSDKYPVLLKRQTVLVLLSAVSSIVGNRKGAPTFTDTVSPHPWVLCLCTDGKLHVSTHQTSCLWWSLSLWLKGVTLCKYLTFSKEGR